MCHFWANGPVCDTKWHMSNQSLTMCQFWANGPVWDTKWHIRNQSLKICHFWANGPVWDTKWHMRKQSLKMCHFWANGPVWDTKWHMRNQSLKMCHFSARFLEMALLVPRNAFIKLLKNTLCPSFPNIFSAGMYTLGRRRLICYTVPPFLYNFMLFMHRKSYMVCRLTIRPKWAPIQASR